MNKQFEQPENVKFDYTKWRQEYFDNITPEQLHNEVLAYASNHPYTGKAKIIIRGERGGDLFGTDLN